MNEQIMWAPGVTLEQIEKEVILKAFRFYRGNKTQTSISLGIAIRTLDTKLDKYAEDGKKQEERQYAERKREQDFIARQRGEIIRDPISGADAYAPVKHTGSVRSANKETHAKQVVSNGGVRMESAIETISKQSVSVQEHAKVQEVLQKQVASGGSKRSR